MEKERENIASGSPGINPVKLNDCIEQLLEFILQAFINGTLDFDLGLSTNFCATLLNPNHDHEVHQFQSESPSISSGLPLYPLYKSLASALNQCITSGSFVSVFETVPPMSEDDSLKELKEKWNELISVKGFELVNVNNEEDDEEDDDFEIGMIRHDMDQVAEEAEQQLEPLSHEEADQNSGGINPPSSQSEASSSRGNEECSEPITNQIETNPQTHSHNIPHATVTDTVASEPTKTDETSNILAPKKWKHQGSHPLSNLTSDLTSGIKTRSSLQNHCAFEAFISQIEPTNITMALTDEYWVTAMQEELEQFERNKVWHLVPRPSQRTVIGTRWVYRNKLDDVGEILRNKARLVVQGFNQQEGIDYDETFAPVARLEAIRMLVAFASHIGIKLFQMDVKTAFLNGYLEEEVFVEQPPGFLNNEFPNHVFKLDKALYGLKQAPRAWYDRLSKFLLENGFVRGSVDKTLFIKSQSEELLLVQVYVDDIIFGATNNILYKYFSDLMTSEFEMSMMGELGFFLGLQIKQNEKGTMIHQQKYLKEMISKFGLTSSNPMPTPMTAKLNLDKDENGKSVSERVYRGMIGSLLYLTASRPDIQFSVCVCARFQSNPKESHFKAVKRIFRYLIGTQGLYLWYPTHYDIDLVGFSDADYAGSSLDRKSTSGIATFLGPCLISWASKKQNTVALSTAESEYLLNSIRFELHVQEPYFTQLKDGLKTVEGRCAVGNYNRIGSGDLIFFNKCLMLEVQDVRRHASFYKMLEAESLEKVLPGVLTIEEGEQIYRNFYSKEKEQSNGVLAICVSKPASQPYSLLSDIIAGLGYKGIQSLLGLKHTIGTTPEALPPPRSTLLSSFTLPQNPNV